MHKNEKIKLCKKENMIKMTKNPHLYYMLEKKFIITQNVADNESPVTLTEFKERRCMEQFFEEEDFGNDIFKEVVEMEKRVTQEERFLTEDEFQRIRELDEIAFYEYGVLEAGEHLLTLLCGALAVHEVQDVDKVKEEIREVHTWLIRAGSQIAVIVQELFGEAWE